MKEQVDICIIGGGIVGLFCALEQAERGKTVRLIDKLYVGSSRNNIGEILLHGHDESTLPFMKFTFDAWKEAHKKYGQDLGFEERKSAYYAYTEPGVVHLEQEVEMEQALGFDSKFLMRDDLIKELKVSDLPENIRGGKVSSAGGVIVTKWAIDFLRQKVIQSGVRIWGSDEVKELIVEGNTVKGAITTNDDECRAEITIISAGIWSNNILKTIGVSLPLRPARCHIMELSPTGTMPHHMLVHEEKFGDIMLKYQKNGRVLASYTGQMDQAQATWSTDVDEECVQWMLGRIGMMANSLQMAKQQEVRSVSTAITPDGHCYLGPVPSHENILLAVGMNGQSYAYAAGVAKLLGMISSGEDVPAEIDMSAFRVDNARFTEGAEARNKRQAEAEKRLKAKQQTAPEEPAEPAKDAEPEEEKAAWVDPFKKK